MGGFSSTESGIEHLGEGWHFQLDSVGCEVGHRPCEVGVVMAILWCGFLVSWRHWMHFMWSPFQFGNSLSKFGLELV